MRPLRPLFAASFAALLATTPYAGAQQIFRSVGPDGRVTFSDKPPSQPGARAVTAPVVTMAGPADAGGGASLPFELRQVASRYPVALYTGPDCAPCGTGRAFLASRGIPFTEKTVTSNEDIEALQRLGGTGLPFLTIGAQQIKGYSEAEWAQFLNAAGYPKTSQLPAGYRQPPATPLVSQRAVTPVPAASAPARSAPSVPTPLPAPASPSGISF